MRGSPVTTFYNCWVRSNICMKLRALYIETWSLKIYSWIRNMNLKSQISAFRRGRKATTDLAFTILKWALDNIRHQKFLKGDRTEESMLIFFQWASFCSWWSLARFLIPLKLISMTNCTNISIRRKGIAFGKRGLNITSERRMHPRKHPYFREIN